MAIPIDSAYTALKDTHYMQNFDTRKCENADRNNKGLITCKEDGLLCYCKEDCPCKKLYKVDEATVKYRSDALRYKTLLKQTPEERRMSGKSFGTLLINNPVFLTKQLVRKGTFFEFRYYLEFLSLEIVNAYYAYKLGETPIEPKFS